MQANNPFDAVDYGISEKDFEDNHSQMIFRAMQEYCESRNYESLLKMVCLNYPNQIRKANHIFTAIRSKINNTERKVVVFGAGNSGSKIGKRFARGEFDHSLFAYIDNDGLKWGKTQNGITVMNPEEIRRDIDKYLVLIPEGIYAATMEDQIRRWGGETIYCPDFIDSYGISEEREDLWDIISDTKNRFFVYGQDWRSFLFRQMMQRAGRTVDFTIAEELGIVRDSLEILIENNYYGFVFSAERGKYLIERGMDPEKIILFVNLDALQYFDEEIVPSHVEGKRETFIDGGCLNLITSGQFMHWCNYETDKIFAFECDERCVNLCKSVMRGSENCYRDTHLVQKGLWSASDTLQFVQDEYEGCSRVISGADANGKDTVAVTSIDEVVGENRVSFIKMDIEGSELEALKGGIKTISRDHPILAISAYHKPEDIIEIPSFIKKNFKGYKLYLRAYHMDPTEVVLYAI